MKKTAFSITTTEGKEITVQGFTFNALLPLSGDSYFVGVHRLERGTRVAWCVTELATGHSFNYGLSRDITVKAFFIKLKEKFPPLHDKQPFNVGALRAVVETLLNESPRPILNRHLINQ